MNNSTGQIIPWISGTRPKEWLLCDGSAVSRTTYRRLFGVIGTSFGAGDGSTTFNLPDLRGRLPLGLDNMGGTSANRVTATQADNLGQASGAESHTLTASEMPSHTHQGGSTVNNKGIGGASDLRGVASNGVATSSTGGGGSHSNVQPYQTFGYVIKI
jgi:microcystin-dependent protein